MTEMFRTSLRSLVALALAVSIPAAAWATCVTGQPAAPRKHTCCLRTADAGGCCPRVSASQPPDCCKVQAQPKAPVVLITPTTIAHLRAGVGDDAGLVTEGAAAIAAQTMLARAEHVPLKLPDIPTYLRISVLLI